MKKFIKLAVVLPFVAAALTGCVAASYKVDGQAYSNRDEAWAATTRRSAEAEAAISAGAKPLVDRKLLVVVPTASAFSKNLETRVMKQGKQYATPGTPARAQDDFITDAIVANFKSVAASLKKANIYREIEVLDVDTSSPNIQPSPSQDVLAFYLGVEGALVPVVYFNSARVGKQVVAVDTGQPSQAERRKSLIDDVKAKALQ